MMSIGTKYHEQLENYYFCNERISIFIKLWVMSTIDALVTKNDVIVYDVDAHACIIDGVRLHMETFTYRHNDLASMEKTWSVLPN
jgi:glycine C-acetyltransferase